MPRCTARKRLDSPPAFPQYPRMTDEEKDDDYDGRDYTAMAWLQFMIQAWVAERKNGNARAIAAIDAERFFGFQPEEVQRISYFKHGERGKHWFILKDGRVVASTGDESEKDLTLYEPAKIN